MAVPSFLAGAFRATLYAGITDVDSIIAALNAELVTNGAWTDESGTGVGPFKSPVNAIDGSHFKLACTRNSATDLGFVATDNAGLLINNQTSTKIYIDAGGTAVYIFSGADYVCIESQRASYETFLAARLNVWPETPGQVRASFVCSMGPRTSAGATTGGTITSWWIRRLEASASAYENNFAAAVLHIPGVTMTSHLITPTGAYVFVPLEFSDYNWALLLGRMPQTVVCASALAYGSILTLPIDTGVTGNFRVLSLSTVNTRRLAIRVA